MTAAVTALWRHPIKGHGREPLDSVCFRAGQTMPFDRRWAVAHEMSKVDNTGWAPCANFSRGAKVPTLMAISAQTDDATGRITLTHPEREAITIDPDHDTQAFLDWVRPLMPANRAQSARMIRVPERGMTDTDYPSVSLINLASNRSLAQAMDADISPLRWRCNIHIDGLAPWAEFDWVGMSLRIGEALFKVREPIERCMATTANPETGTRDLDTLGALNGSFGHQDFGIYLEVTQGGTVCIGNEVVPV